jgi:hypothetical protein
MIGLLLIGVQLLGFEIEAKFLEIH